MYEIKAIPTVYNGVRFRSRLEARWAAFFDLCGWKWEYEPFDLEGWAPDFLLRGREQNVLVEVKPIVWPDSSDGMISLVESRPDLAKARAYKNQEILILGCHLGEWSWPGGDGVSLGVIINEEHVHIDVASLFEGYTTVLDFAVGYGSFHYRIGGQHDGDHHLLNINGDVCHKLWREAGNRVQWRRRS